MSLGNFRLSYTPDQKREIETFVHLAEQERQRNAELTKELQASKEQNEIQAQRIHELEEKLQLVELQLQQYQKVQMDAMYQKRVAALNRYQQEYEEQQRGQGASGNQYPNLRYGVEVADNEVMEDGPGDEGYDEIDGPMPPQPSACNR